MNGEGPMMFMKLPNDLVLNCLARVSRMHYQTLSLVSKRFRSLLASKELYQTRNLLGCTEICLYFCLKHLNISSECWFILCLKPNSSKKVLVPIKCPNSPNTYYSGIAKVGSNIYSIGGTISRNKASSRVMVMDCHSNKWREAPSMLVAREIPSACVLDGKIYVTGGCDNLEASNWMEVFDTKTQTWEFMLYGNSEKVCPRYLYQIIGYDGTLYVQCFMTDIVYKLHEGNWIRAGDLALNLKRICSSSACVIDNVFYNCSDGIIKWYDSEAKYWKKMKGLERYFGPRPYCNAKLMADSGGKLVICKEKVVFGNRFHPERKIWCGEIEIVKSEGGGIWGKLEWSHIVSTTSIEPLNVTRVLAVTL